MANLEIFCMEMKRSMAIAMVNTCSQFEDDFVSFMHNPSIHLDFAFMYNLE